MLDKFIYFFKALNEKRVVLLHIGISFGFRLFAVLVAQGGCQWSRPLRVPIEGFFKRAFYKRIFFSRASFLSFLRSLVFLSYPAWWNNRKSVRHIMG